MIASVLLQFDDHYPRQAFIDVDRLDDTDEFQKCVKDTIILTEGTKVWIDTDHEEDTRVNDLFNAEIDGPSRVDKLVYIRLYPKD